MNTYNKSRSEINAEKEQFPLTDMQLDAIHDMVIVDELMDIHEYEYAKLNGVRIKVLKVEHSPTMGRKYIEYEIEKDGQLITDWYWSPCRTTKLEVGDEVFIEKSKP